MSNQRGTSAERRERDRLVKDLWLSGLTAAEIADEVDLTDRRVRQILARITDSDDEETIPTPLDWLNHLWEKVQPGVHAGNPAAIETARKLIELRAKLEGNTGVVGDEDNELEAWRRRHAGGGRG